MFTQYIKHELVMECDSVILINRRNADTHQDIHKQTPADDRHLTP